MLSGDLIANNRRLPLDEKMPLLTVLIQTVNEELGRVSRDSATDRDITRALEALGTDSPLPPFAELHGVLATDTPIPAEYDWEDDYADYLTKKYA
jgi:hypothetical protein